MEGVRQRDLVFQHHDVSGGTVLIRQQIPRRPVQPGPRVLHFTEAVCTGPGAQEDFLKQIGCLLPIACP